MAWLEAHDEMIDHPKTAALGEAMGWNKFETAGRLLAFWFWCLKYAPTGDLRKFTDTALAAPVVLNGTEAKRFVSAMVSACWLDRSENVFRVHDWPDFTRHYLKNSRFNGRPDKWREVLAVYSDKPHLEETLASNSRANSRATQTTNQPTNLPSKGRLSAAEKLKERLLNAPT